MQHLCFETECLTEHKNPLESFFLLDVLGVSSARLIPLFHHEVTCVDKLCVCVLYPPAVCLPLTCCFSCSISLSRSLLSASTSSWVFFLLEADSSSRAMFASFSLMAAKRACCLETKHTSC